MDELFLVFNDEKMMFATDELSSVQEYMRQNPNEKNCVKKVERFGSEVCGA